MLLGALLTLIAARAANLVLRESHNLYGESHPTLYCALPHKGKRVLRHTTHALSFHAAT